MADLKSTELLQNAASSRQFAGAEFILGLFNFLKATETHEPGNQIFTELLHKVSNQISIMASMSDQSRFEILIRGEQIFICGQRLRPKVRTIKKIKFILKFLRARGVLGFKIPPDSKPQDLNVFFWLMVKIERGKSASQISESLRGRSLDHYEIITLALEDWDHEERDLAASEMIFENLYRFVAEHLKLLDGGDVDIQSKKFAPVDSILYEMNSIPDDEFYALVSKKLHANYADRRAQVAVLSALLLHGWGKSLGLPTFVGVELAGLGLAHILNPMRSGAGNSFAKINSVLDRMSKVRNTWPITELQLLGILEFHQSFGNDGTYEIHGRKCYQHFFSRMLRIVIVFVELISPSDVQSKGITAPEAMEKLLTDHFGCDRSFTKLFVGWLGLFPVGSLVRLSSGELAQVSSASGDLEKSFRPIVRVFRDKDGNDLSRPVEIDLSEVNEKVGIYKRSISETLNLEQSGLSLEEFQKISLTLNLSTS